MDRQENKTGDVEEDVNFKYVYPEPDDQHIVLQQEGVDIKNNNMNVHTEKETVNLHRKFLTNDDSEIFVDHFMTSDVGKHYHALPCENIGRHLQAIAFAGGFRYLPICVPNYNEELEELHKTLYSLLKSEDFMKKARLKDTVMGRHVEDIFQATKFIIVAIFDGRDKMSKSSRRWIENLFPARNGDEAPFTGIWANNQNNDDAVVVTAACREMYCYHNSLSPEEEIASTHQAPQDEPASRPKFEKHLSSFYFLPIIKLKNHRKHNSHQWFFESVCQSLGNCVKYAFLTDCGTSFDPACISLLMKQLIVREDLIGVTARQRVEWPNRFFHPCESAPFEWLKGDHSSVVNRAPCWKCYANYLMGPAPLQGFEFEATLVTNLSIFNLLQALPVMPGPCQMLNWQKMKYYQVVNEYFHLMFKEERNKAAVRVTMERQWNYVQQDLEALYLDDATGDQVVGDNVDAAVLGQSISVTGPESVAITTGNAIINCLFGCWDIVVRVLTMIGESTMKGIQGAYDLLDGNGDNSLTFTEFLRTNMRLAEDRVLSFVSVFSTRDGTMWIPGA